MRFSDLTPPILARALAKRRTPISPSDALPSTPASVIDFQTMGFFTHRRMSPADVRLVLDNAVAGSIQAQWELFALMEDTWPRLQKNLSELRRAAARATYSVSPYAARGEKPSEGAQERAALIDGSLRQWWPRPGTLELSFEDTLFHALDAFGKGVSVLEIHWDRRPEGILPRCTHQLSSRRFAWNQAGTELGLAGVDNVAWQPFPVDRFLVGIWQGRSGAPISTATLRALAPYWAGVTFGWEWLLSNAQIFGVPFRWATYDKNNPGLGTQLRDMLAAMGASGYGAFPEGTKLEFKEAAQNATGNPQVIVQELADKACDLLILGQELSGGAQAAGLGGGAAGLQGSVRADRLQAAAQWCADLLNYQLVPAILRANWGETSEPPSIVPDVDEEPDPLKLAERDQVLLTAGIELPRAWFYERHGIPMPVDGEATLTGRAPAAPGGFGGGAGNPAFPGRSGAEGGQDPALAAKTRQIERARGMQGHALAASEAAPASAARSALFEAGALEALSPAQSLALRPVLAPLLTIAEEPDAEKQRTLLAAFRADLPRLAREVLTSDENGQLAEVFGRIIGPAFVSGLIEGAQARPTSAS